jgi:alpha-tubulin suppressor-like RCC1 family protein
MAIIDCVVHWFAVDGHVFSWGRGKDGRLGHDSTDSLTLPKMIATLDSTRVVRVACGWSHSIAVAGQSNELFNQSTI